MNDFIRSIKRIYVFLIKTPQEKWILLKYSLTEDKLKLPTAEIIIQNREKPYRQKPKKCWLSERGMFDVPSQMSVENKFKS